MERRGNEDMDGMILCLVCCELFLEEYTCRMYSYVRVYNKEPLVLVEDTPRM